MAKAVPRSDVLLALMGAPHVSDLTTTALRMTQALVRRGGRVQVWTCGYATALSQQPLGEHKPRNVVDWSREYPSTCALVRNLLSAHSDQVAWYACRFCSEERGMVAHLPEIGVRPPFKFHEHVAAADKTLFMGVI